MGRSCHLWRRIKAALGYKDRKRAKADPAPTPTETRPDAPPVLSGRGTAPVHLIHPDPPEPLTPEEMEPEPNMDLSPELFTPHSFQASVQWHLTPEGISIDGAAPEVWGGPPTTCRRIYEQFGDSIRYWSQARGVPAELILATILTESGGDPNAVRLEPGYVSDETTPNRVSPGLMQTLISTARDSLKRADVDRAYLLTPDGSIAAGSAYIAWQGRYTKYDPPKVAAAYNAGGLYLQDGTKNRWKMRQYPIGTGEHVDRFVRWFNEAILMFRQDGDVPGVSFTAYFLSR